MDTKQGAADFLYCEEIIKKHSKSFYYAFSQLPEKKAKAIYAIYAFCRSADDRVDENIDPISQRRDLERLKHELDLFNRGEEINHPLWRALRHVFNHYDMDIQPFYDQLIGQGMDIDFKQPNTLEQLEDYSYYVAGTVGYMLLPIIGSKSMTTLKGAAIDLGVAMQITNILRDIGEDYQEKERIYLPKEDLDYIGYSINDLSSGVINESFIELWEKLALRAEVLYDSFTKHIHHFDSDSQMPVALSAQVYRGILNAVRDNDYDCLSMRNYVAKEEMEQMNSVISK